MKLRASYLVAAVLWSSVAAWGQFTYTLGGLCPATVSAGAGATTVVLGISPSRSLPSTTFVRVVQAADPSTIVNGFPITLNSSNQYVITVDAATLSNPGSYLMYLADDSTVVKSPFAVTAADPIQTSNAVPFNVIPPPQISGFTPAAVTAGNSASVTILGNNFIPTLAPAPASSFGGCPTQTVVYLNSDKTPTSVFNVTPTTIQMTVPAQSVLAPGVRFVVQNQGVPSNAATLPVNPALTLTGPETLPLGVVGQPYTPVAFSASGGTGSYAWSLPGNNLGLTINPDSPTSAVMSGTPNAAGTFRVTVQVRDQENGFANRTYDVTILPAENIRYSIDAICPGTVPAGSAATLVALSIRGPATIFVSGSTAAPLFVPSVRLTPSGSSGTPTILSLTPGAGDLLTSGTFVVGSALLSAPATYSVDLVYFPNGAISSATAAFVVLSNAVTLTVAPAPHITSVDPAAVTRTANTVTIRVHGENFIPAVTGAAPSAPACGSLSNLLTNETPATDVRVLSSTEIQATLPAGMIDPAANPPANAVKVVARNNLVRSNEFTIQVNRPPTIDSPDVLPSGIVGRPYPTTRITASGGTQPLTWSMTSPDPGLTLTPDGTSAVLSGTPTTTGPVTIRATALDQSQVTARRDYTFTVLPAASLTLALPATTVAPNQADLQIAGPAGYPVPLTGDLQLSFQPSPDLKANPNTPDPALSLAALRFTTDPATGRAVVKLTPGLAAGTITVRAVNVTAAGVDIGAIPVPLASTVVASGPPVITGCALDRSNPAILVVRINGNSPTREVTRATFAFAPASGEDLGTTSIVRDDAGSALFGPYYNSNFVSFQYDQSFVVNGSMNAIGTVTVTLDNSKGSSQPMTCQ